MIIKLIVETINKVLVETEYKIISHHRSPNTQCDYICMTTKLVNKYTVRPNVKLTNC